MILITQTEKKQYHAVEVPCHSRVIFGEHQNSYGDKSICYWDDVLKDSIYIRLNLKSESHFEIIGIQGGGDSLSTEQAKEVVGDCLICNNDGYTAEHDPSDPHEGGCCSSCPIQVQCEYCMGGDAVGKIKYLLKAKGIETENLCGANPREIPLYQFLSEEMYKSHRLKWMEAESKLKRVVIIKSDI